MARGFHGLATAAGAAALLVAATGARAEIQFCNKFAYPIFIAIAYAGDDGVWTSRGWLKAPSGDCAAFDASLKPTSFYYRGQSATYRNAAGQPVTTSWGGGANFAVSQSGDFVYRRAEQRAAGATLVGFSLGAEKLADSASATVTFEADGRHTTVGVRTTTQRLAPGAAPARLAPPLRPAPPPRLAPMAAPTP